MSLKSRLSHLHGGVPLCGKGEKSEEETQAGNTAERSHSHLHTFPEQKFTRQPYKTAGKYAVMGQPGVHPSSHQGRGYNGSVGSSPVQPAGKGVCEMGQSELYYPPMSF